MHSSGACCQTGGVGSGHYGEGTVAEVGSGSERVEAAGSYDRSVQADLSSVVMVEEGSSLPAMGCSQGASCFFALATVGAVFCIVCWCSDDCGLGKAHVEGMAGNSSDCFPHSPCSCLVEADRAVYLGCHHEEASCREVADSILPRAACACRSCAPHEVAYPCWESCCEAGCGALSGPSSCAYRLK